MRFPRTKRTGCGYAGALFRFTAVVATGSLVLAACGGADDTPDDKPSGNVTKGGGDGSPLQSQVMMQNGKVRVDLMAVERVSDKAVIARMRVVNQDAAKFTFGTRLGSVAQAPPPQGVKTDPQAVSGITLFDPVGSRRHFPLMTPEGKCLCTRYTTLPEVAPGQSLDVAAAFPAPPASVGKVGVLFPNAPAFLNVPVTNKPGATLAVEAGRQVDPGKEQTAQPRILPVSAISENATGVEEDRGDELRVRVSADVLFALNKADLTPRAEGVLKEVAAKIDKSTGATVTIDGYTDNSGNDAINNPLSQRRAQSVQSALQRLVTRAGITYQARGHGSADPVASNDSERGRALNRRVTVAFARPKPAAPPSAPAASGTAKPVLKIEGSPPPGYAGSWPKNAKVEVGALRRQSDGYTMLEWTVTNEDATSLRVDSVFNSRALEEGYFGQAANAVALEAGEVRYRVLRDAQGYGFSSYFLAMNPQVSTLTQGESLTLTAVFKLPAELPAVTVAIPGFGKAQNVPVQ